MTISQKVKNLLSNPLVGHMLTVGVISLLVSFVGFYKETVIASKIGLTELLDTFYLAMMIPAFIQNVFIGGINQLFIPNYLAEQQDLKKKKSFQSITFLFIGCFVAILSIVSIIFIELGLEYVFPGHDIQYYTLIRKQFYIILPCLLFWGLGSVLSGLLQIQNKFLVTSISRIFPSIGTLITLLFFKEFLGEYVLAVGVLAGTIAGLLFLTFYSLKHHVLHLGQMIFNSNIKSMLQQLPAKITSSLFTGINPFVDQFFAAQLVVGSIAAINFGIKIPTFAVGILMLTLGNVLLPHFSKLVHQDLKKAYQQLFKVLKVVFIFSAICSIIGISISTPIIKFLFERDAFTAANTIVVSLIQIIALIYVPFFICTLVCVKFLTAINKNSFMARTSLWNLVLNIFLNWWLIKDYGVYGLVASTTLVYIICSLIYVSYTRRLYRIEFQVKNN